MKKSVRIESHIDPTIKGGDIVKLTDGSALTCDESKEEVFIVFAYPTLTTLDKPLKELNAVVTRVGVIDSACPSVIDDKFYLQDIEVRIGEAHFKTASKFVKKV